MTAPPTLTAPQRALLFQAAGADAVRLTSGNEHRPADALVELGLLRDAPAPEGYDEAFGHQGRRLAVTVHGTEMARYLARCDLGIA